MGVSCFGCCGAISKIYGTFQTKTLSIYFIIYCKERTLHIIGERIDQRGRLLRLSGSLSSIKFERSQVTGLSPGDQARSSDALTYPVNIPRVGGRNRLLVAVPSPATLPPPFHSLSLSSSTQLACTGSSRPPHLRYLSHDTFPLVRIAPHARCNLQLFRVGGRFPF